MAILATGLEMGELRVMYKCSICGKEDDFKYLPYGWSEVHEESSGAHDSAAVVWKYDSVRCFDCRQKIAMLIDELKCELSD